MNIKVKTTGAKEATTSIVLDIASAEVFKVFLSMAMDTNLADDVAPVAGVDSSEVTELIYGIIEGMEE